MNDQRSVFCIQRDSIFTACRQCFSDFYSFPAHMHQNAEIYFITKGMCSMSVQQEKLTLKENDFIIIFPNVLHSFFLETQEECRFEHIHFNLQEFVDADMRFAGQKLSFNYSEFYMLSLSGFILVRSDDEVARLAQNIVAYYEKETLYAKFLANINLLHLVVKIFADHELFHRTARTSKSQKYVLETIQYIQNHYGSKVLLDDIASSVHISSRYLSKIFYEETGITILGYLNIYRINQAIRLMENDKLALTDISELVGLNDIQHFSKLFRKIINLSPQKYRKLIGKNKSLIS